MTDDRWRAAWDIYEAACELPAGERRSFAETAIADFAVASKVLAMLDSLEAAAPAEPTPDVNDDWPQLGKVFGRFTVTGPLGRGATCEVYAGLDTELNRAVALKFLGQGILGSTGNVDRVVREAQTASSLNHPAIVTVYEVIRADQSVAFAMELVEGQSLRAFCGRPNPVSTVVEWGRQVAGALAAAHGNGIVHRDIKPENLMLRPDGYIKVLDFGMARRNPAGDGSVSDGAAAGTLRYMSPEQVRGGRVQAPSDMFSLGIVLYELVTGAHPFQAESPLETPYAIATREPDPIRAADPSIPEALQALIGSMLDKDPAMRPDADRVAADLGAILAGPAPHVAPFWRWQRLAGALACAALMALGSWFVARRIPPAENTKPAALLPTPAPVLATFSATDSAGNEGHPAFSPDGMRLAYEWDRGIEGRNRDICVKPVSGGRPLVLTSDPEDDFNPAWSPDGRGIAFLQRSGDQLNVILVSSTGGAPQTVGTVRLAHVASGQRLIAWSPDGESLTVSDQASGHPDDGQLSRLTIQTGEKRPITLTPEGASDVAPAYSPNGKALAFLRLRNGFPDQLFLMDSGSGQERLLTSSDAAINSFAWSPDGRSLVYSSGSPVPSRIWSVAIAGGAPEPASFRLPSPARQLAIAIKGNHLAYARPLTDSNVWRLVAGSGGRVAGGALAGQTMQPLLASSREDLDPRYSPDGESIAFASRRTESLEIWVANRDGSRTRQITWQGAIAGSPSWSPNGRQIAFDSSTNLSGNPKAVWLVGASGAQPRRLMDEAFDSYNPTWSHDGVWVYFGSTRGGKSQIWKARVSGGGRPEQVTRNGGFEAYETSDGKRLYYTKAHMTAGIWRMPLTDGEEEQVQELSPVLRHRYWEMADTGIYFVDATGSPRLRFFDFATDHVKTVASLPDSPPLRSQAPAQIVRGLAVAPGGREFLNVRFGADRVALVIANLPAPAERESRP